MIKKVTLLMFFVATIVAQAQTEFSVNSQTTFDSALDEATSGDIIIWEDGTYADIFLEIGVDGVTVQAETPGGVIFNGGSRAELDGDDVTLSGVQFVGGDILVEGSTSVIPQTVITVNGSRALVTNVNVSQYSCFKYLRIRDGSQYSEVTYSNFENRANYADQNIMQIDVNASQSGYHTISHCSFKNFSGVTDGGDDGVEPIRIGASSQASYSSKTVVEYCYFTGCEGDGEIISHKATDCIYRYNTFEGNEISELVLRHGDNAIVYGNFFINGRRGIRVREGSGHIIFNNYFGNLTDRTIYLVSSGSVPVEDITIAYNTIVDSERVRLSDATLDEGEVYPANITFLNNIFSNPMNSSGLLRDATGSETWVGNIADSEDDLGITTPATGFTFVDPELSLNSESLYELGATSPAINASVDDAIFPFMSYADLDYDNEILLDVLGTERPATVTMKDVGCQEYAASAVLAPHATEENTGVDYEILVLSSVDFEELTEGKFSFYPNPVNNGINLSLNLDEDADVKVEVYSLSGKKVSVLVDAEFGVGSYSLNKDLDISSGIYLLKTEFSTGVNAAVKVEKLIKK